MIALPLKMGCELSCGMPVVFSAEIDLNTMQAGDFQVTTASGKIGSLTCVTLWPAADDGELRTVLLVGEYGSAEQDPPVRVEIVGHLHSIDNRVNFKGAEITVTPLEPGPSLVFAEIVPQDEWRLGDEGCRQRGTGYPAEGIQQISLSTFYPKSDMKIRYSHVRLSCGL